MPLIRCRGSSQMASRLHDDWQLDSSAQGYFKDWRLCTSWGGILWKRRIEYPSWEVCERLVIGPVGYRCFRLVYSMGWQCQATSPVGFIWGVYFRCWAGWQVIPRFTYGVFELFMSIRIGATLLSLLSGNPYCYGCLAYCLVIIDVDCLSHKIQS